MIQAFGSQTETLQLEDWIAVSRGKHNEKLDAVHVTRLLLDTFWLYVV